MLVAVLLPVVVRLSLPSGERRRTLTCGRDLGLLGSAVTATHRAACRVATSQAQVHGDRHSSYGVDVGWQSSGRPIEGRDPWTHR
jgi:hypothetical protein